MFYFIFILFGISIVAIDPLIPIIAEELKVGYDKIGIAILIGSIFTLISTFISGRLSDKLDIKKIVIFGLFLLIFGFLLFGFYLNYIIFILVLLLIRAGFGTIDTSIHAFSSKLFRANISKIFINLDISWFTGAVIGPILISATLFSNTNPKYVFLFFSLAFVISLIFFYKICPKKVLNKAEMDNTEIQVKSGYHVFKGKNTFSSVKNPIVILNSLILFFYMGAIAGFSSWLTTYFLAFEIKVALGSAFLSFYWIFSILGLLIINKLLKKAKEITLLFWGCLIGTLCLTAFGLIQNIYIKIIFLSIQALFFSGIFPLTTSLSAQEGSKDTGTILGFNIAFAFSGSIVFQPVFGYIAEYYGKNYTVFVALTGAIIGLIFTIILFKILKSRYRAKIVFR